MDITLGLDFGTHQSKLCMSYMPANEIIHEFLEFDAPDGSKTPLFPSVIQINEDETISIGFVDKSKCLQFVLPEPKEPSYPEEPCASCPEEPIFILPSKPKPKKMDWKDQLKALKKGATKGETEEEKEWKKKCKEAYNRWILRHEEWTKQCLEIKDNHDTWQSRVSEMKRDYENNLKYWNSNYGTSQQYRYFKIATFSDFQWNSAFLVNPDILSVWYIAFLMLKVKEHVLGKFGEKFEESVSVQMGIPTGANTSISKQMRNHAFRLLVAARELMELFNSPEHFCSINYKKLIDMTAISSSDMSERADSYGFSVLPEAFAGLQSLTNKKRLSRGNMHILVDIGGGTTDVAFFTITEDLAPNIHKVVSFHKGLNYVFDIYCRNHPGMSINDAQEIFFTNQLDFSSAMAEYTSSLNEHITQLIDSVISEFISRVRVYGKGPNVITYAMLGCPVVYCGGGSMYNKMRIAAKYFTDIRLVNKDTLGIPNLRNRGIDDSIFTILATSYGLSIPMIEEPHMIPLDDLFDKLSNDFKEGRQDLQTKDDHWIVDD